ncbi:hypothetical protein YA0871_21570 [Pseudomonas paralactis]|uniref:Uncharacterized protein n=1 Tax=Pseudomonas paralactis TaxID=1615673 RepID=A0ABS0V4P5_9PSED|nr:hypothetical protein [Pseudomonas paralactis]MBI6635252.1 hypothetical protein [Pseudomonas paralactis]
MPAFVTLQPRFPFGGLTISPCVNALIRQDLLDPLPYERRQICGDWGDVCAEHWRYNDAALQLGGYLQSSYVISDGLNLCVFTEAGRNLTAVFLLAEYWSPATSQAVKPLKIAVRQRRIGRVNLHHSVIPRDARHCGWGVLLLQGDHHVIALQRQRSETGAGGGYR